MIAAILVAQIWFTHAESHYYARLVLVNVAAACLFGAHAKLLSEQGLATFAKALTYGVLV